MAMRLEATLTIPALMDFTDPEYHPDYRVNVLSIQATKSFTAIGLSNGKIYLLDDDGKSKGVLESHGKMVWTMTSWPDSHLLITGDDNDIRVWDTNTRACLQVLSGHESPVRVLLLVDKSIVVSCSLDSTVRVWNTQSGACLRVLRGHAETVMCAVASGDLIVSGSEDTTARVWSISRGECVHELKGHETPLYSMIFLKDKSKVAAGASDGAICIWDVRNGSLLATLSGNENLVCGMVLNSSNQLVSYDAAGAVRLWNLDTYQQDQGFIAHPDESVTSMDLLNDHALLTGDSVGRIRLWRKIDDATSFTLAFEDSQADRIWRGGIKIVRGKAIVASLHNGENDIRIWGVS